jgi:Cdc6-like AAA superfamily ATPase
MPRLVEVMVVTLLVLFTPGSSSSAEKNTAAAGAVPADTNSPDAGEEYTRAIRKRVDAVIGALDLKDPKKADEVRDIIISQYRALKDWHDAHDTELKELGRKSAAETGHRVEMIKASLKTLHDKFLSRLSEKLTPEQVEKVKDRMTYNVVHVTYDGYCQMLPGLTDEQKAKIMETLKTAREEAMDGGSSEEKHAIFGRYKGRVNNYLSSQGYDLKKASKEWNERRRKAKDAQEAQPQKAK